MISAKLMEQTWQRIAGLSSDEAQAFSNIFSKAQPVIVAHLLQHEVGTFNQAEKEQILYIGFVAWQALLEGTPPPRRVSWKIFDKAFNANYDTLDMLSSDSEADFLSATLSMLENYPEPEVMRYIVDAIMDEESYEPDDEMIREELRGLAFVHLKIAVDAMIEACRPNRPRKPRPRR